VEGAPLAKPGSNGGDAGGDYAFAKYNKKVELVEYNEEEWEALGLAEPGWGRAETDYLFQLCRHFDLRFPVIADRYDWAAASAAAAAAAGAPAPPPAPRGVHELKARYYAVARTLIRSRADSAEEVAHKELVRAPYAAQAEAERREALADLLQRSAADEAADAALLAAAAEVEARRRAEVEAAKAAGLPPPLHARPAGRFGAPAALALEDVDVRADPGGPELPTPRGGSARPPPGAYVRGAHTVAMASELQAAGPAAGARRDRKSADAANKRIDQAMEELGVRPPAAATRAVCRAWYALRREVGTMLELRAALARRAREAAAGAAGFGAYWSAPGGEGPPGLTPVRAGWPGAAGGAQPLSPGGEEGEDGRVRREHKRKLAPRYEEDVGPASSPPKAAKRPKPRAH